MAEDIQREFIRQMIARMERSERRHAEVLNRMAERIEQITEVVLDHRDEGRAQTRALLKIVDRLEGNGPALGTT